MPHAESNQSTVSRCLSEKLYPEKSDKVYGIDSLCSSVPPFFMREYPREDHEFVVRHARIVVHATLILWSLCTAYLIISNPVCALSL